MSEPMPAKMEMPPKPPEAKPKAPPKEQAVSAAPAVKPDGSARGQLEAIAKGTPVAEATAPKVEEAPLPDREKVKALLTETNTLLLELRDMRLLVSAVATNAADTALGNEMQLDTLRIMSKMSNEGLPPDAVLKLDSLKKQIGELKLPERKPENSALLPIINEYNQAHPDKAVPIQVIDQIKAGNRDSATTVATLLQTNQDLSQSVWKQLTGVEGFTGLHPTPENILALTGLPQTDENLAKAKELFGKVENMKMTPKQWLGEVWYATSPYVMFFGFGLMFVSQMVGGDASGGGGH